MKIYTIGVYGSTEKEFFDKLVENCIDTFCDIRQRRGVRGSEYAFVNSNRLQNKLAELNIQYGYIPELAPTTEIREHQKSEDLKQGERKKDRNKLGSVFSTEFKNKIIEKFAFDTFIEQLKNARANRVVLFCVEGKAEACHRSIVANELNKRYKFEIEHL
ncbi:MAG: DUF488 domain-containing protein [Dysgonamonadaceae bacterium]|jgi:uncharacterized protein (DUF488 family)|nr:DUF488 domain-containing protein [Dysgonamonadaceae bacterium]